MSQELICSWLKIPPERWPPDHYTLVGLPQGESDAARIERHIHERHEWLLRYQLAHPEQVTEALNRLAQAFICLTDPAAKRAYDVALLGKPLEQDVPAKETASKPEESLLPVPPPGAERRQTPDPLGWLYGPWTEGTRDKLAAALVGNQPAAETASGPTAEVPPAEPAANGAAGAAPMPATAPSAEVEKPRLPPPAPTDPVVEAAQSAIARRGLGTKRALYYRISRTRQLLRTWVQVGKYVGDATTQLRKRSDAVELVRLLTNIRQLLQGFPPLLGQAGQPGYLVIALARQPMILQTFLALLPTQREALVRDWQAGLALLAAHRLFLREELWGLRRKSRLGRSLRAVQALFGEHPGLWLLLVALVALNVVYPSLRETWPFQVGTLVTLLLLYAIFRGTMRRSWLRRQRRAQQ
jgi:hypothetical protein